MMERIGRPFEDWIDEINQACRASRCDFRMEIIGKLRGAVCQVVMACDNLSDDDLLTKTQDYLFRHTYNESSMGRFEELKTRRA